ncbi:MAG: hypothetical protein ACRCWJ_17840 [Casimicrobium sp.]
MSCRVDVSDVVWLSAPFPEFVLPAASPVDPSSLGDWQCDVLEVVTCMR